MAVQIKSFTSIVAGMVNRIRSTTTLLTDFNVGGVTRTIIDAIAQELDELYLQTVLLLRAAIQTSVYTSFNFPPLPEVAASGLITVTFAAQNAPYLLPANSTFTLATSSVTYASQSDVQIAAGATSASVLVVATDPGSAGNIAAGSVFSLGTAPPSLIAATNPAPIINGADAETPQQQQIRFAAYISSLARSTLAGVEEGLATAQILDASGNITEQVVFAKVVEPYLSGGSPGLINCFVHNGVGSTSAALVAEAQLIVTGYTDEFGNQVPGFKAAGVSATFAAAAEQDIAIAGVLTALPGYQLAALEAAVSPLLDAYVVGLGIGVPALYAELIAIAMNVQGVGNFVLSSPTADTTPAATVKLMPGAITLT